MSNLESQLYQSKVRLNSLERSLEEMSRIRKTAAKDWTIFREEIVASFRPLVDDVDVIYEALRNTEQSFEELDEQLKEGIQNTERECGDMREKVWKYEKEIKVSKEQEALSQ